MRAIRLRLRVSGWAAQTDKGEPALLQIQVGPDLSSSQIRLSARRWTRRRFFADIGGRQRFFADIGGRQRFFADIGGRQRFFADIGGRQRSGGSTWVQHRAKAISPTCDVAVLTRALDPPQLFDSLSQVFKR